MKSGTRIGIPTQIRCTTRASLIAMSLAALICANARAQDESADVAVTGPSPRFDHAMAYDAARSRLVLFGGVPGAPLGDTWEWDGASWTLVSTTGPSPRRGHAMAYDSVRGRMVLFGGENFGPDLGDTWEWDGASWTLLSTTGPMGRFGHAMTYDTARGRVVLFGGWTNSVRPTLVFGDTWEWDGASWTQRSTAGPAPRSNCALAYDSARGRVVLFGGMNPTKYNSFFADTWEWDGTSWTSRRPRPHSGPSRRAVHAMSYDSVRGQVVLFGGADNSACIGETWAWNGTSWTLLSTSGPPPRTRFGMAYDSARGRVMLFGGRCGIDGDTWEWDGAFWIQR